MKRKFLFAHKNGTRRSVGQAVAAIVMALAVAVGGVGTTALLVTQPAGLTVEPSGVLYESGVSVPKKQTQTPAAAEQPAPQPETSAAGSTAAPENKAEQPAPQPETSAAGSTAAPENKAEPTASQPAAPAVTAPTVQQPETPAAPETQPEEAAPEQAQPALPELSGAAGIEEENSFPMLQTETEALAAEDPLSPPTAAQTNDATAAERAAEQVEQEPVMLTPEQIQQALELGRLDETDTQCLPDENGFFEWLWELLFGKPEEPEYSGWRTEDGKTYYYDPATHQALTGIQSIDGKLYYFDESGVQQQVTFGIDVSKYQTNVDWNKVKQAGAEFVMIRIGYRGYGSGALVLDPMFEQHFANARNAGLRVGVYFFSQAVNEAEAMEEAQGCWYVLNGRKLDYPIYFDSEASGASGGTGRADGLGTEDRTKCAVAFCEEVRALGYEPGVYASTRWFQKRLNMSQLTGYSIWNAHYDVARSGIECDLWQGTCTARISGYNGEIDVNISYIG